MKTLTLMLLLTLACGGPEVPPPSCATPIGAGEAYPLSLTFDGSLGVPQYSAAAPLERPVTAQARVRNAVGNSAENVTELNVFLAACDGGYLGSITAFSVGAGERPGEWLELDGGVDLAVFPEAAQAVLVVRPLYATGQHLVDVEGFEVSP